MRSKLSAKSSLAAKPKFLSIWHILSFIVVILAVLFFFYPKQSILQSINKGEEISHVTRQYIHNLVVLYPQDANLKLLLAQQDIYFGNINKALKVIEPYLKKKPETPLEWKAQLLSYKIIQQLVFNKKKGDPEREIGIDQMRRLLPTLAQGPYSTEQLKELASDAVGVNKLDTALAIYTRVLQRDPKQSSVFYAQAGTIALAAGQYRKSAQYYFLAKQHATTLSEKRKYFILALKSYESGNLLDEGLTVARQYIAGLQHDQKVLLLLVKLALAANKAQQAQFYAQQLLHIKYQPKAKQ